MTAAAQALATRRRAAMTLVCTLAIQVMATAGTLAFAVLAPAMPGVALSDVGVFLAVVYAGGMIGSACGGSLVGGVGPVRTSQLSLLAQAIALGMLATGEPGLRLPAAILIGLGYGPVTPASSQILARTTAPERMNFVFSLKQTGVPLGGLLGGVMLPLLTALASWQVALGALAVAGLIVAALAERLRTEFDVVVPAAQAFTQADGQPQRRHGMAAPFADALSSPRMRALVAVSILFSACQLSVSGYLMVFLTDEIGIALTQAGMIYAVAQGAGIVGRIAWGHLADRTGSPRRVLVALAVLMGVALSAAGLFGPHWPAFALAAASAALGATAIGWNGVYLGEVARLARPGRVASTTGGALFFTYIGVVAGPPAFGYLAHRAGSLGLAYLVLATVPALAVALLCWGAAAGPGSDNATRTEHP